MHTISSLIEDNPMLRVGIAKEATNDAHFVHVPSLDLDEHVTIVQLRCESKEALNSEVSRRQAVEHNRLWDEPAKRPPWRVIIFRNDSPTTGVSEDLMFSFHHSIMDGKSGMVFHQLFLSTLKTISGSEGDKDSVLSFPRPPNVPVSQEDVVPFSLTIGYMAGLIWNDLAPSALKPAPQPIWSGKPITFSMPYSTGLATMDFPVSTVAKLRAACRQHDTTLTGLFHALVFTALTNMLRGEDALGYSCATPVSLRDYCRKELHYSTDDALRVLVCSLDHKFGASDKSNMQDIITSKSADLDIEIWRTANRIRGEIVANANSLPRDSSATTLKYIGDFQAYWAKRNGKARSSSWECSNIGSFDRQHNSWPENISRIMFSNGATVTGSAIGVNVVSVEGGPLTVALSWQKGIVEESVAQGVQIGLADLVHGFAETGQWRLRS